MPQGPNSPSPLAGEGLGSGVRAASAAHKSLSEVLARKALLLNRAREMRSSPPDAERRLWSILRAGRIEGFRILRFWNSDILANSDGVVASILDAIDSLGAQTRADPTPQPLSRKGRGAFEGAHNG